MCQFISTQTTLLECDTHARTHPAHTHTRTLFKQSKTATPCPVVNSFNPCLASQMGTLECDCCISFLSQQPVVVGLWAPGTLHHVGATYKQNSATETTKNDKKETQPCCNADAREKTTFRGHQFPEVTFGSSQESDTALVCNKSFMQERKRFIHLLQPATRGKQHLFS